VTTKHDIVISGGGIGGLTAAIALHQGGHRVRVIERAPAMGWGQGVQISPHALAVLADLGLAEPVIKTGQVIHTARKLTREGLVLRERHFGKVSGVQYPHVAISRGELQLLLAEAAKSHNIPIELNQSITAFAEEDDGVSLAVEQEGGIHSLDCEVLLGADGIHSIIRKQLFPDDTPRYTGFIQYRGVIPLQKLMDKLDVDKVIPKGVVTVYGDARNFYSYYRMNELEISFGACVHVGEENQPRESWSAKGDAEELIQQFEGFTGPLAILANHIPYLARMHIFDHANLPHWSGQRVSLLGDAAHAMLPFAGQATVTAIEDAAKLAELLSMEAPLAQLLSDYQSARIPHVARIRDHCRDRGGIFEEYLVAEKLEGPDWTQLGREEQQQQLSGIDWSRHDSFLRELY
jgi:salicylate hydroxylase